MPQPTRRLPEREPDPTSAGRPAAAAEDLGLGGFRRPATDDGLSLAQLSAAFAEMLSTGLDPYTAPVEDTAPAPPGFPPEPLTPDPALEACPVSPRSILEALLFVGDSRSRPLSSGQAAALMRGVRPAEIDELVRELNDDYASRGAPYHIVAAGEGYRLELRDEYRRLHERLEGGARRTRLSGAALEVLALAAYRGPLTAETVARERGVGSRALLAQLVRRGLLRIDRPPQTPRQPEYRVTRRFLDLFGLESLDDLPRPEDLEQR